MKWLPSPVFAVPAIVALASVLAATSHTSVLAPIREGEADPLALLSIVAVAFAVSLGATTLLARAFRLTPALHRSSALPVGIVVAVGISLFGISRTELRLEASVEERVESGPSRAGRRLESDWRGPATRNGGRVDPSGPRFASSDWTVMLRRLIAALGAAALATLVLSRTRGRRGAPLVDDVSFGPLERAAAHGAIVTTIEAMLDDPDPRTAIIGAYARLLEELDANGASRRPHEGPSGHLTRILTRLELRPDALRKLVQLFEIARFSDHNLTARHRSEALEALHDAAEDLSSPPVTVRPLESTE